MADKYIIKFFRSGLHESGSLMAQCEADARTATEALEIARIRLTPKYPEVANCKLWSVDPYPEKK